MKNKNNFKFILKKIFFEDITRKIVALIITLIVWFGFQNYNQDTRLLENIWVQLVPPQGYVISGVEKTIKVKITARGSQYYFDKISNKEIIIDYFIDPKNITSNNVCEVLLTPKIFNKILPSLTIVGIEPPKFLINVSPIIESTIPINPIFSGNAYPGYQASAEISPNQVLVRGPKNIIEKINHINTQDIILDETISQNFICPIELKFPENITLVKKELVKANVTLRKIKEEKTVSNIPIQFLASSGSIIPTFKEEHFATIRIFGDKKSLSEFSNQQIKAFVDLSNPPIDKINYPIIFWCENPKIKILQVIPNSIPITLP